MPLHVIPRFFCLVFSVLALLPAQSLAQPDAFRPPAVPLVTHDPYFSVWSMSDRLTDIGPSTGLARSMPCVGSRRIDGKPYRFMAPAQLPSRR